MDHKTVRAARSKLLESPVTPTSLAGLIENHTGGFSDVLLTPELARAMLRFNTHNRPVRKARVDHFAQMIRDGKWINTAEPLIFSKQALNEGQHRLAAIEQSGIAVPLDVRFGVDERAFVVTGTGARRTAGDMLALEGISGGNGVAAAANLIIFYERQRLNDASMRWQAASDDILAAVRRWPDLVDAQRWMKTKAQQDSGRALSSFAAFVFLARRHKSDVKVDAFVEATLTGVVSHKQDPARLLRERLNSDPSTRSTSRSSRVRVLALYLLSWQLWLENKRPDKLQWVNGDPFPFIPDLTL